MTQLLKCDQCDAVTDNDQRPGWLICTDLDSDDEGLAYWHFCGWPCLSTYAMAKTLVEQ